MKSSVYRGAPLAGGRLPGRLASQHTRLPLPAGGTAAPGCRELKCIVAPDRVSELVDRVSALLPPDPHAGPDGLYQVTSVYLDTPRLELLLGSPRPGGVKYRVRRYGTAPVLYLEEKRKRRGVVTKCRAALAEEVAGRLLAANGVPPPSVPEADWFVEAYRQLPLRPWCQVRYRRLARVGVTEGLPVRLTLDQDATAAPAVGALPSRGAECEQVLPGVVLELKFPHSLPLIFRQLLQEFALKPVAASKYRRAMAACGLDSREGDS
jgi:hypothetical protein